MVKERPLALRFLRLSSAKSKSSSIPASLPPSSVGAKLMRDFLGFGFGGRTEGCELRDDCMGFGAARALR